MTDLWRLIRTNRYCGLAFIVVILILVLFFWKLIDSVGYYSTINGFMADLWFLAKGIIAFVIMIGVLLMMFGRGPFRRRAGGRGHH